MPTSRRKTRIQELVNEVAPHRLRWREHNRYFYDEDTRYMRFLIRPGLRILDLGCGIGDLLAELRPSYGVGIDFSQTMLELARARHPALHFVLGDVEDAQVLAGLNCTFDVIVLSDTIGSLDDCEATLRNLHDLCHIDTRIVRIGNLNALFRCQELYPLTSG